MTTSAEVAAGAALARMFELGVRLTEAMDQGLGEQGLTRSRAEVIWRLHHMGPVTQRALSEALRCTPRNVTGLVDALEATGHVARLPHPSDRRAMLVTLTERGRATAIAWQSAHQELAVRALADLGKAQIADLIEALDQVLENLRGEGLGPMPARHG
ncbi:MAG TPA: MarR family transcriptional regulator [Candidatus Dormibacteraeota bacterium]|nr:MarR family transcriptional regulator [Candidatus Dormibacteraeota bacterium]